MCIRDSKSPLHHQEGAPAPSATTVVSPCRLQETVHYRIIRAEFSTAMQLKLAPIDTSELLGKQTARTLRNSRRREAERLAGVMFSYVPTHHWLVAGFCHRLLASLETRRSNKALSKKKTAALFASSPCPIIPYDVGVAHDGSLTYRSPLGKVGASHPG